MLNNLEGSNKIIIYIVKMFLVLWCVQPFQDSKLLPPAPRI